MAAEQEPPKMGIVITIRMPADKGPEDVVRALQEYAARRQGRGWS